MTEEQLRQAVQYCGPVKTNLEKPSMISPTRDCPVAILNSVLLCAPGELFWQVCHPQPGNRISKLVSMMHRQPQQQIPISYDSPGISPCDKFTHSPLTFARENL